MIKTVFEEFGAAKQGTVYTDPTTDSLFEVFQIEKAELFVANINNEIVGCCGIYPTEGLPSNCVEIVKFYISNKARGLGIGTKLFDKCETFALKNSSNQLYIESIPEFNKAISIYKRLGFKSLKERLGNSGHFGCDIWLSKELTK